MKSQKINNWLIVWMMVLCFWLVILFLDGAFSSTKTFSASLDAADTLVLASSWQTIEESSPATSSVTEMVSGVVHQSLGNSELFQDLNVLEYLYTKNKNPELLQPLVEKFLQYYQFDKANMYLDLLVQDAWDYSKLMIDPHQVLYARFHNPTLGLEGTNALDSVFTLVQDYRARGLLSVDDEYFYKWLKSLRVDDYDTATAAFSKIADARYKDFKASYEASLANFVKIKNPPSYYKDGLVSLTLLKNWYFVFAKKLALRALLKDENYILPYQVLAYTNFLTHNREAAKDYFLKLADFDTSNAFLYKFLIGVSYYRYGDYEQSILYLRQVTDPGLQIDVYRYMLLWYIQGGDTANMMRIWQNLLGESSLQASDFSLFFDQMFYLPFRTGQPFSLYSENPQLVDLYLGKCSTLFTGSQANVCTYGEVWLQFAQQNLSWVGEKLLSLTAVYHQSHLYHMLGDYYFWLKQYTLAKDNYVQALSICDNTTEQTILQNKIEQTMKGK